MKLADIPQLRDLSVEEKLKLVEELWADIAAQTDKLPIPEWHVREIQESEAAYKANPHDGSPWAEVKARILDRK
jgi:putative addiction module component (TIGR02574 family)